MLVSWMTTNRCNLKCAHCFQDAGDATAKELSTAEAKALIDGVARAGFRVMIFSGGEPLLHRELPEFLRKVRQMGFLTKVDTNGNHPKLLRQILEEGLADYIAMDIKNSPEKYAVTIGLDSFDLQKVRESIRLLMESGIDHEFRTTVVAEFHEESDFYEIGEMIRGADKYFLQSFTDRDSVPYGNLHAPDPEILRKFAQIAAGFAQTVEIRGID